MPSINKFIVKNKLFVHVFLFPPFDFFYKIKTFWIFIEYNEILQRKSYTHYMQLALNEHTKIYVYLNFRLCTYYEF